MTYFLAISVAAHAALFALATGTERTLPPQQEIGLEIGLVTLPRIDKDFRTDRSARRQPKPGKQSRQAREQEPPEKVVVPDPIKPVAESPAMKPAPPPPVAVSEDSDALSATVAASEESPRSDSAAQSGASPAAATEAAPVYALNPAPEYPEEALRYGWEGEVWLEVDVRRNGTVARVRIDQSSGYPVLDRTAARTVRIWQFEPARIGDETIEGTVRIPIRFQIRRT